MACAEDDGYFGALSGAGVVLAHLLVPLIYMAYPHNVVFDDGVEKLLFLIGAVPGLCLFNMLRRFQGQENK